MLELKQIRDNYNLIEEKLKSRSSTAEYGETLQTILKLDQQQRELEVTRTQLNARSNEIGKLVGQKSRQEGSAEEVAALKIEGQGIKNQVSELDPPGKRH